jgi:hypothetical protein
VATVFLAKYCLVSGENAHRQGLIVAAVRDDTECGSSLSGEVGNRSSPPAVHVGYASRLTILVDERILPIDRTLAASICDKRAANNVEW